MKHTPSAPLSRRRFLQWLAASGAGAIAAGCRPNQTETAPSPPPAISTPTRLPSATRTPPATSTPAPSATPTPSFPATAAIGQADSYDPAVLRKTLGQMLDSLGGLGSIVRPGDRVGIKANLTGSPVWDYRLPVPAVNLFVTHPAVVGVLGELLLDAGAGSLVVVDGLGDPANYAAWGYTDIARPLNAGLVDLCTPEPFPGYAAFPVGPGAFVYDKFSLNPALGEVDVFISVAKMKVHSIAGVTLALKNLFGLAPISLYRVSPEHNHRSAFHASYTFDTRVPRVILDLCQARPIHFALIDGVLTGQGGAGPWDPGLSPVQPGLLVASADPVAADAVSAAIMGFDPAAPSGSAPFEHCDNYLALARELGLGTHLLDEIGVTGPAIEDVRFPFRLPGQVIGFMQPSPLVGGEAGDRGSSPTGI